MLTPNYITKIEGHGKLNIDFGNNKAKLVIEEGERLFEGLVLGRPYQDIPFIVSRICGVCPTSHYLASIKALESALEVKVDEKSIMLRKILLMGQIIQSHILHTFFLALPDYANFKNVSDLAKKYSSEFSSALSIKKVADKVVEIIGGRAVHPVTPTIGGFAISPSKKDLAKLRDLMEDNLKNVIYLTSIFAKLKYPTLKRETKYLAINSDKEYAFYDGMILSNHGNAFEANLYKENIEEIVKDYSTAKFAKHHDRSFMVGALARISINPDKLNSQAKRFLDEYFPHDQFPSYNSYHNVFAQMIEIIHCFEEIILLSDKLISDRVGQSLAKFSLKAGKGVGAIEAPRGILYHYYEIDKNGIVIDCDIITPTVQNLTNLEEDANELLEITKTLSIEKREQLLEMLVRAYDPCITCSVH